MYSVIAALFMLSLACGATGLTLVHNVTGYTLDDGELVRFAALERSRPLIRRRGMLDPGAIVPADRDSDRRVKQLSRGVDISKFVR